MRIPPQAGYDFSQGKVAVVTGANKKTGEATCRLLAVNGWNVLACARRIDRIAQLAAECGPRVRPIKLDNTNDYDIAALAAQVNRIDLLVIDAGTANPPNSVLDSSTEDWAWMFETNVLGTLRVARVLMPALLKSSNARIVVVVSMASLALSRNGGAYSVLKSGISNMMAMLRKEIPPNSALRVSEIHPGPTNSELVSRDNETPVDPSDIAECIRWLATLPPRVNIDLMNVVPASHQVSAAENWQPVPS